MAALPISYKEGPCEQGWPGKLLLVGRKATCGKPRPSSAPSCVLLRGVLLRLLDHHTSLLLPSFTVLLGIFVSSYHFLSLMFFSLLQCFIELPFLFSALGVAYVLVFPFLQSFLPPKSEKRDVEKLSLFCSLNNLHLFWFWPVWKMQGKRKENELRTALTPTARW